MRWENREESDNVEDRRGQSSSFGRGGGFPIPLGGKSKLLVVAVVLIAGYYGIDLTPLLTGVITEPQPQTQTQSQMPGGSSSYKPSASEQQLAKFSKTALKMTEDAWTDIFRQAGSTYVPPKMVLYTGTTQTACGYGQSAMGPFYCPRDRKLYIDLSFYNDMKTKLGGGGDFALGYVLAHEVGHHVQNLLGISDKVQEQEQRLGGAAANRLSVRMELQADCLAGVWGNRMQRAGVLEAGDLEKALRTATAIGDDRLQRQSTGRVVPDSFTHGTSQQRYLWFKKGFDSGVPGKCDTFSARSLDQ